jgi:hypothetical protein
MEYGQMPLMRYFMFVGGGLLALLLIASACLPTLPMAQNSQPTTDHSNIRIHSDHKWPERVVFDTSRPTVTPAPAPTAVIAQAPVPPKSAAAEPAKTQVREAFAEMRPNPTEPRNHEPRRKRKSVAKNYYGPPRIVVAQQPPAFLFGNNVW